MLVSAALERIDRTRSFGGLYDLNHVLNETGRYFFACRPWRFCRRMSGYGHLNSGVDYVALPVGCVSVLSIERDRTSSSIGDITLVDAATFNAKRTEPGATESGQTCYYATQETVTGVDGKQVRRLALNRAATETVNRAFRIAFEAGWTEVTGEVGSNETLPVPDFAEPLFGELLDAVTLGLEEPVGGSVSARVAQVVGTPSNPGPLYAAAVDADMRAVPDVGLPRGTWMESSRQVVTVIPHTLNLTPS
jgi:hypothetical protein